MKNAAILSICAIALVAACAPHRDHAPPASPPTDSVCNADAASFAVGRPATAALGEEVRQAAGARRVRVMEPDKAYTMEFDAQRVNLVLDRAGNVQAVRCG